LDVILLAGGSGMTGSELFLFIFGGFVLVFMSALLIRIYNSLVELRQQVDRAWSNIDVILEQRSAEIPKLIVICEQYTSYEKNLIQHLVESRKKYISSKNTKEKIQSANQMTQELVNFLAIAESYPQLQSNSQFLHIQSRISSLENEISARKETVNDTVTQYNTRRSQFPELMFASLAGFTPLPLYKVAPSAKLSSSTKIQIPS